MGVKQLQAPVALVVVALVLLATAPPLAHAQFLSLPPLNVINVNGTLCCTATGNCPAGGGGIPLSGVLVRFVCNVRGNQVTVGQSTTSMTGAFNIVVNNVTSTIGSVSSATGTILPCITTVSLPVNRTVCTVLRTATGSLVGITTLVGTVVSTLTGLLSGLVSVTIFFFVA